MIRYLVFENNSLYTDKQPSNCNSMKAPISFCFIIRILCFSLSSKVLSDGCTWITGDDGGK